jgi:phenylacetate-CoA ligase
MMLTSLRRGSRASPDLIERRRRRLLADALAHARERVPLYRRLWQGLPEELAELPIVTREQIRDAFAAGELPAEGAEPARSFPSTGTGGDPLWIPRGAVEARMWRAGALRTWFEHGHGWTDATAHFDSSPGPPHPLQRLGVARTAWIPPDLPEADLLERFVAARADFVAGTPTVLRRLCRAIESSGARPRRPKAVFAEGEVLDLATSSLLERVLGVIPVDLYGSTEAGYVGWQCERREHLHVNAETCLVELLVDGRPARPGELGRVVVTQLLARTAPMIRYDTGDVARAVEGPCPCGRTLPLMGCVQGRASDSLGAVTTRELVDHLAPVAAPDRYQVHRRNGNGYELRPAPEVADADELADRLAGLLGEVKLAPGFAVSAPKTRVVV